MKMTKERLRFHAFPIKDDDRLLQDIKIYNGEKVVLENGDIIEAVEVISDEFFKCHKDGKACYFDSTKEIHGCPLYCIGNDDDPAIIWLKCNDYKGEVLSYNKIISDPTRLVNW